MAARGEDFDVRLDQLKGVAVAGDDDGFQSVARGALGQRAQDVIGFEAFRGDGGQAKGLHQLHDAIDLRHQLIGHLGARAFVLGIHVVAESAALVEGAGDVVGLLVVPHFDQHRRKAIHGIGEFTAAGGETRTATLIVQRQAVESPIGE